MNNHSNKNLYKLTLYSGILKTVFTMITGIISVPLILNYFGTEKYGALNVITSYIAFLAMANLGLNSGASILINKNTDFKTKITILKRAVIILFIILPVIIFLLCLIAYLNPNWINIFNFPNSIQNEAKIVTIIMIAFTFINLPFSLLSSALIGFQKNHIENLFSVLNLTFSILCTLAVIYLKKNFIFYAFLTNFIILIINIIKTLYFFKIKKSIFDSYSTLYENQSDTSYTVIAVTSYRCMLGAIAAMLLLNTDNIVIAKYIGIQHVTEFSITFKVYTILFSLIYLFNSSIIPLLGKNINNRKYLQKIYNNTHFTVIILGGLFWIGTVAFGKTLILLWVGENGYAGIFVLIYLGAYSYIFSIVNLNYIMINTLNHLKGIIYITMTEGVLNLILSIILGKHFGLAGIAAGTFLGTLLSPFLFFSVILRRRTDNLIFQNNSFILKHFIFCITPAIILAYFINENITTLSFSILGTFFLCIFYLAISYFSLPEQYKKYLKLFLSYKSNQFSKISSIRFFR